MFLHDSRGTHYLPFTIDRLEEAGVIGELQGKKKRTVYPDKVAEFLRDHGYVEDVDENDLNQKTDITDLQADKEPAQEHYTESNAEVPDFQGKEKNSELDLSQLETKQHIQIAQKFIKEHTDRYKGKKKPVH